MLRIAVSTTLKWRDALEGGFQYFDQPPEV